MSEQSATEWRAIAAHGATGHRIFRTGMGADFPHGSEASTLQSGHSRRSGEYGSQSRRDSSNRDDTWSQYDRIVCIFSIVSFLIVIGIGFWRG